MKAATFGTKQHARQDLNARTCRDRPRDDRQLLRELLTRTRELYPRSRADHGVAINHVRNLVVVIGAVGPGTSPGTPLFKPFLQGEQTGENIAGPTGRSIIGP